MTATWLDDGDVVVHAGDCIEVMETLDEASIDVVITDPPYGLAIAGREWDRFDAAAFQAWSLGWGRAAFRVLKPGGHLLAFGGTRTFHRLTCGLEDAGFEIRDCLSWLYGSGFPKSHNLDSEHAGRGTALKPAWEPIILARKPLNGTVAANVQEHGTGALNIDAARIGTEGGTRQRPLRGTGGASAVKKKSVAYGDFNVGVPEFVPGLGRWPANVAIDEAAAVLLDAQAGQAGDTTLPAIDGDTGGPSRFFYTGKASTADRNNGHGPRNTHPTVKPTDLMRWLVRLATPPGGVILDPFAGSGTTGVAARAEGRRAVLIEREPDYLQIIAGRLAQQSLLGGEA